MRRVPEHISSPRKEYFFVFQFESGDVRFVRSLPDSRYAGTFPGRQDGKRPSRIPQPKGGPVEICLPRL